jgi:hypothetical protein
VDHRCALFHISDQAKIAGHILFGVVTMVIARAVVLAVLVASTSSLSAAPTQN